MPSSISCDRQTIHQTMMKMKFLKRKHLYCCVVIVLFYVFISMLTSKIPKAWKKSDIQHIFKSLIYWQRINLDSAPIQAHNLSFPFTRALHSDFELSHVGHYNNFILYKMDNEKDNLENFDSIKELETFLYFQPMLSMSERNLLLYTLYVFLEVCSKFKLTYFAIEGTLLGSYRHFGIIPWDDDIDLIMDVADWKQIRNIFSGVQEVELMTDSKFQWKLFPKRLNYSHGKSFKYPFLDIFFYDQDDTHIWSLTPSAKSSILFNKKDVFPLKKRPFENLYVNVPKNLDKVINSIYDVSTCLTGDYLHKRNTFTPSNLIKSVPCKYLYNLHPFVFRQKNETVEVLKLGHKTIKVFRT